METLSVVVPSPTKEAVLRAFFFPLWLYRKWRRTTASRSGHLTGRDDFVSVPAPMNTVLTHLIAAERFVIRHVNLPFGVTLLALARRRER